MFDFQHTELLFSLLRYIVKIGKVLGPWPTVVVVGLFLGLVAFLSAELFDLAKYIITKAALAAFSFLCPLCSRLFRSAVARGCNPPILTIERL
jgi:hypothetical protein